MKPIKDVRGNKVILFDNELGFDELKALKLSLHIAGNSLKRGIERETDSLVLIKDKMNHGIATLNDMTDQMDKLEVYKTQKKHNDAMVKKLNQL